jgi:glycine/D-amino acid oxidase-like deaminating enzyme
MRNQRSGAAGAPLHAGSYYAATRNDPARYPRLDGDLDTEVCIIGGGFSGVSTALTLAERGAAVTLVEANLIGWGASGRNGGQMIAGIERKERLTRVWGERARDVFRALRFRGHEIITGRIARYAIDCDLVRGAITAATRPGHMKKLEAEYDDEQDKTHVELVDRETVRALLGTDAYHGGLIERRDGHLHPLNLCLGEARAAASLGVRIFEDTPAMAIKEDNGLTVTTPTGRVRARSVVIAGNAYHRLERRRLGGLLFPAGSYIICTEPLGAERAEAINRDNLAVIDSNLVIDYFRLTPDRRLLFGGLCHYSNRDPRSISGALRPRMERIYPGLARARIDYEWGGHIGIVITRVPLIRRIAPEIYVLQGYSGHGLAMSHIASEIVADAICGHSERLELFEKVPQWRIPAGQWLGNQILALGMAWYRLKDWLG